MELLDRLEQATDSLLLQNQQLKLANMELLTAQQQWREERTHVLAEIERILKRLDDVELEES